MDGHVRIYPYWAYSEEEFYNALFDWFFNGEGIQWSAHSVEKGLIRTKNSCSRCGMVLDKGMKTNKRFESHIDPKIIPPVDIAAEVPIVTCTSCGLQQVYGDPVTDGAFLNQMLRQTILEAFDTVHLEP